MKVRKGQCPPLLYRIIKIFRFNDFEVWRKSTTLDFTDCDEALDFCKFATTPQDKRGGIEYAVCPILTYEIVEKEG